ncbi:histidine phosphatase family protein [Variovorax dokdonensis]|uniref:Histidine phosphatase family protein n=1 Tax=Variovorax dokdonensis TaxID=344883 RepID=A0ABT7N5J6_9BURK|nr:histidine phosphatase family protein [Variovorax dokdonensis]MDM0043203.1 histidine phosphatase family protein [Variovorax dokdonensis]
MQTPTRIIAVRHGETDWNASTRLQGQLDIELNAKGRWQAQRAGRALAREDVGAVYSSDLARAWQTAEAIAAPHGVDIQPDQRLRERAFGEFEGRTFADIERELPDAALLWRRRDPDFSPPGGGENLLVFQARVVEAVAELAARHPGELVVLVAHGGVMDVLYRAATRQELQAPRTWQLGNTSINRLLWTEQGLTLVGWADDGHLEGDDALDEAAAA